MLPIRAITDASVGTVLYHSAFGFATVRRVETTLAFLAWETSAENLPERVSIEVLRRVYARVSEGGFFYKALHEPDKTRTLLEETPLDALFLLLHDLHGKQRQSDLRDWLVGRLMQADAFTHWWAAVQPALHEDGRFKVEGDAVSLASGSADQGPRERLKDPLLAPARRLDLALRHRKSLPQDLWLDQVLIAWRFGAAQVRDLALAATRDVPANLVIKGLLQAGVDSIDALVHAIRRSGWAPSDVDPELHQELLDLLEAGVDNSAPLDREGRLAAALIRWQSNGVSELLADMSQRNDGKRLVRATLSALPPRRAEAVARELLHSALEDGDDDTAQWLGGEMLGIALIDAPEMADRLVEDEPELSAFFIEEFKSVIGRSSLDTFIGDSEEALISEVDLTEVITERLPLGQLPPRSGASLLGLGLGISRALSGQHKEGHVVNPTAFTVMVLPNETIEVILSEDSPQCPRPLMEAPSPRTDVYAAAVLLLEVLLGRPWPRTIPAHRAIPYLRGSIPLLPPSSLAPLDAALHPQAEHRPQDGLEWLAMWQSAAVAEETRAYAIRNANSRLHIGYDSHIGRMKLLLTQINQDALFVSSKGPLTLLVCCDGISTANAGSGDVASSIASHVIANLWEQALPRLTHAGPSEIRHFLDRALRTANTAICESALRFAGGNLDGRIPMGTTAVVAVAYGNHVSIAWLGDSRAYLVGPYGASLLTADENQACERLRAWHLNFLEAWDPAGFALVGYLGHFNELNRPEALSAHHTSFVLLPGERLVMNTDGVTDYIGETHPQMAKMVHRASRGEDINACCRRLTALANQGGGGDNCSLIMAELMGERH